VPVCAGEYVFCVFAVDDELWFVWPYDPPAIMPIAEFLHADSVVFARQRHNHGVGRAPIAQRYAPQRAFFAPAKPAAQRDREPVPRRDVRLNPLNSRIAEGERGGAEQIFRRRAAQPARKQNMRRKRTERVRIENDHAAKCAVFP